MPEIILKQLQYESDAWKRLLIFIKEENVFLKNRLSDVLKDHYNDQMLLEIEYYQENFIKEDEWVMLLRNEVAEFDKLLMREIFEDGKVEKEIIRRLQKLRNNIAIAEKQFASLKSSFTGFLSENLMLAEDL